VALHQARRSSIELARRGYIVHGIDLSPELIDVARRSIDESNGSVSFAVGDIVGSLGEDYAGILCRGVLNDILDDEGRDAVFAAFARALRPGGVLILDVREWGASVERKTREPLFRKRVSTDRGELTFTSVTALDPDARRLVISEQHALLRDGVARVSDYRFVMRCWEREELRAMLVGHGFCNIQYFGAYDPAVEAGATDRLAVVAQRSGQPRARGSASDTVQDCTG
jgi:SAM-dependent methyltransferase